MSDPDDPIWTRWSPGALRILSTSTICAAALIWWLVTSQGWVPPLFLPGPGRVVSTLGTLATDGFAGSTLWEHAMASLVRVFIDWWRSH